MFNANVLRIVKSLKSPSYSDIISLINVRNEILRLPNLLNHYRNLGVNRFVIVDNASSDGTMEYISSEPDVDVWFTNDSFAESLSGTQWINYLARKYGHERWYLLIDADELLVYTGMEDHDLHDVINRLQDIGHQAIRAPMIDMYSQIMLDILTYVKGDSLIQSCSYFDSDSYWYDQKCDRTSNLKGGPRVRLVSTDIHSFDHCLEKYPLRYWNLNYTYENMHHNPNPNQRLYPTGALLHFKFLNDFKSRIQLSIKEKMHWMESIEYKRYNERYESLRNPYYKGSKKYEGPESLVDADIINAFPW